MAGLEHRGRVQFKSIFLAFAGLLPASASPAADPFIAEFLAASGDGLRDEDGDASDWIEIQNPGPGEASLEGWFLTDDPWTPAKWRFPAVAIPPGGHLVVFASGKDRGAPEIHASFRLDAGGEYLALVRPDGRTRVQEFTPAFPPQREDVSYGLGIEAIGALVAPGAAARMLVPADGSTGLSWTGGSEPYDDSPAAGWIEGPTGIGFDLASDDVPPILFFPFDDASAPAVAPDRSGRGNHGTITSHLAFAGSGGAGRPAYTADGGGRTGRPGDRALDFGLRGDGALVTVASAAAGAFDSATVNDAITISLWILGSADQPASDSLFWGSSNPDGTGIRSLNAHVPWSDSVVYWDTAGCCDESQRISRPEPDPTKWKGRWNHWVFVKDGDTKRIYENGELFFEDTNIADLTPIRGFFIGCAPRSGEMSYGGRFDDFAVWDRALTAVQVAALARGASPLALSSLAPFIATDVSPRMLERSPSIYVRIPFDAPQSLDGDRLILRMRYDDGFVAYLNGIEAARRNAPEALRFDAAAAGSRPREAAIEAEEIDLSAHLGLLRPGRNILAIHGLNESPGSRDLIIEPELLLARGTPGVYLRPPTPGRPNGPGFLGFVEPVHFGRERGLATEPFDLDLSCPTEGASILYTLDGSVPVPENPVSRPYTGPFRIEGTAVVRAAARFEGFEPSPSVAHTWIFPAEAERQPARPPGLPATWSGGFPADYGVDPDVVRSALPGYGFEDALRSIPTISIAMPPEDLWSSSLGIYANSAQVWERPASVELIHPDGTRGFGANAGVRIHGYTSRDHNFTPKHSFRVLFKGEYGPTKLDYPLFPDAGARRFDQFVLRGMSTDSWPVMDGWDGPEPGAKRWRRERSLYLREQWMKDSLAAMGRLSPHGIFVHLFLDGLYWGIYSLTERPTDSFLAEHLGGGKDEFDVLKDFAEVQSGEGNAWREMMALAAAGLSTPAAYERIQGNFPDGTRNPAYPKYLDLDDLIDYMILHIYASADDWPNHNWWAGRRRGEESEGFRFFPWDQEISNMDISFEHTSWGPRFEEVGAYDSPSYLYAQLRGSALFRLRFADAVQRHLLGRGVLTAGASADRLSRRAEEIDRAIVAESARWGDSKRAAPFKREVEWLAELDRLRDEYFPALHPIALGRFRRVGLFPAVAAPVLSQDGGRIEPGFELRITAAAGKVWYTLDGTDPRSSSGGVAAPAAAAGAEPIVLAGTVTVKARALSGSIWSALAAASFQVDIPLRITEIHYHPADPPPDSPHDDEDLEFLEVENVGASPLSLDGIGIAGAVRFDFSDGAVPSLDPGGMAVIVRDIAAFADRYEIRAIRVAGEYEGELHNAGERIVLEGPAGEAILDFRYSDLWYAETDGGGRSLVIRDPRGDPSTWGERGSWRPGAFDGGAPGIDESAPAGRRVPGDLNGDGSLDISDPVALLGRLFAGDPGPLPCDGSIGEGGNLLLLDATADGRVDLSDIIHVLGHLFLGGPPHARGTECVAIPGCAEACPAP